MKNIIRIISDTHGKNKEYYKLLKDCNYSIQLGDCGFDNSFLAKIDANKHRLILGNHNNFDDIENWPHFIPHGAGPWNHGGLDFFYVSGAFSIDWKLRKMKYFTGEWPVTWWEEEQLTVPELEIACTIYERTKPDTVITHDCPRSIANLIGDPAFLKDWGYDPNTFNTRTSEALECMFEAHQPKLWIFGHYHKTFNKVVNGTRFICKPELGFTDLIVKNGKVKVV